MTLDPRAASYSAKDLGRRLRWIEDRLKFLGSSRGLLDRGSVTGSVTTIRDLLTSPRLEGWNTDSAVATADNVDVSIPLTFVPASGTLHVRQNGVDLAPSEWHQVDRLITVSPSTGVRIRQDDLFTTAYFYDVAGATLDAALPAATITFRDYSPGGVNAWTIPAGAVAGDLLVATGMVASSKVVTENGWTLVGESNSVTHATAHSTYTYRMVVLTKIYDGTATVPTLPGGIPQAVCLMVAFDGGASVNATFATLADGLTASTPAIDPSSLRVWGTLANTVTIVPASGTQVGYSGGTDIDIVMTLDSSTSAAAATVGSTAGWCLASLVVR